MTDPDRAIEDDLRALAAKTRVELPTVDHTASALATSVTARVKNATGAHGGTIMESVVKHRRRLVAACALAAGLLAPLPYHRVASHDVTLRAASLSESTTRKLAGELARAVGADGVRVEKIGSAVVLTASVRSPSRRAVERRAAALVRELAARHLTATAEVTPRLERVWGSVYAMAHDRVAAIRVELAGKSDAEVEAELREQLAAIGLTESAIELERTDDGGRVEITAHGGDRTIHVVEGWKGDYKGAGDDVAIQIDPVDVKREPGMTDEQLMEKIRAQLRVRGLSGDVVVDGDKVQIRATKEVHQPAE